MGQKKGQTLKAKEKKRVDGCFLVFLRRVGVLPFAKTKGLEKKSDLCHNAFTNLDTKPNDALSFPIFLFLPPSPLNRSHTPPSFLPHCKQRGVHQRRRLGSIDANDESHAQGEALAHQPE